jgi:hypothetical protein
LSYWPFTDYHEGEKPTGGESLLLIPAGITVEDEGACKARACCPPLSLEYLLNNENKISAIYQGYGRIMEHQYDTMMQIEWRYKKSFTAYVEYYQETKLYVGIVPEIPSPHRQEESLDELKSLKELIEL